MAERRRAELVKRRARHVVTESGLELGAGRQRRVDNDAQCLRRRIAGRDLQPQPELGLSRSYPGGLGQQLQAVGPFKMCEGAGGRLAFGTGGVVVVPSDCGGVAAAASREGTSPDPAMPLAIITRAASPTAKRLARQRPGDEPGLTTQLTLEGLSSADSTHSPAGSSRNPTWQYRKRSLVAMLGINRDLLRPCTRPVATAARPGAASCPGPGPERRGERQGAAQSPAHRRHRIWRTRSLGVLPPSTTRRCFLDVAPKTSRNPARSRRQKGAKAAESTFSTPTLRNAPARRSLGPEGAGVGNRLVQDQQVQMFMDLEARFEETLLFRWRQRPGHHPLEALPGQQAKALSNELGRQH